MQEYIDTFLKSFSDFARYTWNEITFNVDPWYVNYFWWLVILSLVVWGLEIAFPWRKNQPTLRKDFGSMLFHVLQFLHFQISHFYGFFQRDRNGIQGFVWRRFKKSGVI